MWVSLNSLRLRKWFGSQPSPASLARKRQTSEIRHLFHLADPVEGPRAYITKTNIRHFRGLHHKNGIKLVGFSCAAEVQIQSKTKDLHRNSSQSSRIIKSEMLRCRISYWRCHCIVWMIVAMFRKLQRFFVAFPIVILARWNAYFLQQATCRMTSMFKTFFNPPFVLLEPL